MELIAGYLSENIDEKQREALFAWVNAEEANKAIFDECLELWAISDQYSDTLEVDSKAAWIKMEDQLEDSAPLVSGPRKVLTLASFRMLRRIAAILLVALGLGYGFYLLQASNPIAQYETGEEERMEVSLPDGSKIWVNENSRISFDKQFDNRQVHLEGEAFFDIKKVPGKTFEIFSGPARTQVLGTAFNVRAYPDENTVEVTVERGKVALADTAYADQAVELHVGQYGILDKSSATVKEDNFTITNATSWKTRRLVFRDTPMDVVIEALERHYGITIEVTDPRLFNCHYTATFDNLMPEDVIGAVAFSMFLNSEADGNHYKLVGTVDRCN